MAGPRPWQRHLVGLAFAGGGLAALCGTLMWMNRPVPRREEQHATASRAVELVRPPPPPPAQERPPPPPRPTTKAIPRPDLALALAAPGTGAALFDASALARLPDDDSDADEDASTMIMTADAVDTQPRPVPGNKAPEAPPEAQRKRVSGAVTVRMIIDDTGQVREARVVSSSPPGFFDAAVLESVARWRFEPATYRGRAVSLRVDQTIRFNLG